MSPTWRFPLASCLRAASRGASHMSRGCPAPPQPHTAHPGASPPSAGHYLACGHPGAGSRPSHLRGLAWAVARPVVLGALTLARAQQALCKYRGQSSLEQATPGPEALSPSGPSWLRRWLLLPGTLGDLPWVPRVPSTWPGVIPSHCRQLCAASLVGPWLEDRLKASLAPAWRGESGTALRT